MTEQEREVEELAGVLSGAAPQYVALARRNHMSQARDLLASVWLTRIKADVWEEGCSAGVSAPANRALGLGNPMNPYKCPECHMLKGTDHKMDCSHRRAP